MAVTTQAAEYKKLRSYLSNFISGPVTDAILNAIALSSEYLVNTAAGVNDSLYIATASGQFLDLRLSDFGITRDPTIGLSDPIFSALGIQVKNRKQVRDLINNILDIVFSDQFVKATSNSQNLEPYALQNGDTLIINFDGANTSTITFSTDQFVSIGAALAQEVANAISIGLSNLGVSGSAILANDGNGNYVQLVSDTIGASSSIIVLGGRAQNELLFPSAVAAGGNAFTQWTLSIQDGGDIRYTWSGGPNPGIGVVDPGQYVNVFGGGFASSANEGTFPIVSAQGGLVNQAYFQVYNPTGTTGVVVQGTDDAILFYTPVRETIQNKQYYAAVYAVQQNTLQIFMPATTQIIERSRIGSMHLHGISEQPVQQIITFLGNTYPSTGPAEYFLINYFGAANDNYVWLNVSGGNTDPAPIAGFTGIEVTITSADSAATVANKILTALMTSLPTLTYTILDNVITITNQVVSTIPDAGASTPNTLGSYVYDLQQGFVIGGAGTTLTSDVNSETGPVVFVVNSVGFPDSSGYFVLNYGCENQELIPYIATPSGGSLLINPSYFVQQDHFVGESVLYVSQKAPVIPAVNGTDYQGFLTDDASARVYAQDIIKEIVAAGITINFTILYPNDIGLGKWGTPFTEVDYVYGP